MDLTKHLQPGILLETAVYIAIGLVAFGISLWVLEKMVPSSIIREIEEEHNTALGIVIGSIILGVAMILSAVLR